MTETIEYYSVYASNISKLTTKSKITDQTRIKGIEDLYFKEGLFMEVSPDEIDKAAFCGRFQIVKKINDKYYVVTK